MKRQPTEPKPVQTIADIARIAGVSKATVSRALNDSELIAAETKERIREIAREHDFQMNVPARRLSLKRSRTIAFVTYPYHKAISGACMFGLEIMAGISSGLHASQYDMLVVHIDREDTDWPREYLDTGRVDGFVLLSATCTDRQLETLIEMGAPFIIWGMPRPGHSYCSVTGDNVGGGRIATEHLLASGRGRIAFLGGPAHDPEVRQRYAGYAAALAAAERAVDPALVAYAAHWEGVGAPAMYQLLEQAPDLDAVVASSDLMAIEAMEVLREQGRAVPDDVAVIGYDDLSWAEHSSPPLTTVNQNVPLAGRLLAQNLIEHLETGTITNVTVPVELVVRRSA